MLFHCVSGEENKYILSYLILSYFDKNAIFIIFYFKKNVFLFLFYNFIFSLLWLCVAEVSAIAALRIARWQIWKQRLIAFCARANVWLFKLACNGVV